MQPVMAMVQPVTAMVQPVMAMVQPVMAGVGGRMQTDAGVWLQHHVATLVLQGQ